MIPLGGFTNRMFLHTIPINDDNEDERDSMDNDFGDSGAPEVTTIDITLTSGNEYKISETIADNTVSFRIRDNDVSTLRLMKLRQDIFSVDAGESIIYSLQRENSTNWNNLYVNIEINIHESIPVLWRIPNRVLIPEGEASTNIEILTRRSSNIADTATIQVRIVENSEIFEFNDSDLANPENPHINRSNKSKF